MSSGNRILFLKQSSANAKFITNDREILAKYFQVRTCEVNTRKGISTIWAVLKQFLYLTFNIYKFRIIYIWFADYHSFFPVLLSRLTGKKSVICAGGYEATYIPEINCGVFCSETFIKRVRRFAVEFSLKNCSLILPVDESLIFNVNNYIYSDINNKEPLKDGIKQFIPEIKTKFITLYPGYDEKYFIRSNTSEKRKRVLSAGLMPNEFELKRKGFDILIEAAKIMKEVEFVLIGFTKDYLKELSGLGINNLTLIESVSYEELIGHYSKAKVFAQISLFEGFPSTVCEAMLCECIPVGSNVNGLPRIIGDTGFIVNKKNPDEIVNILYKALKSPDELGLKARDFIIKNFSLHNREIKLNNIITNILKNQDITNLREIP